MVVTIHRVAEEPDAVLVTMNQVIQTSRVVGRFGALADVLALGFEDVED
jgi:hypothetical protein